VTDEASFSGGKVRLLVKLVDLAIELFEHEAKWPGLAVIVGEQGRPVGPEDSEI
jgi:hypothetical protein